MSSTVFHSLALVFRLNVTQAELAVRLQADAKVKEFVAGVTPTTVGIETLVTIG